MKKAMFIGPIGCGKTTLIQRLNEMKIQYNKTQTIEYYDNIIDTPGEYVEHRFMYSNLMTSAMGADIIVLMQSATDPRVILPTGFSSMFSCPTIGIVTKTDVANDKDVAIVKERLDDAGADPIISISSYTDTNIDKVSDLLA
ncbi:ethanolamine utilization protein EutP [Secundilactobacillus paracollinoides]|uniref:EutP/PduV family microcompartment system protein n=1 Tax=Secundilactobacillus paracollinoides TaxID=240427 RepID=UPI0006D016B9|nr:EutP/PduV family microcompartment system protein [Secundilactobacillus paracollinoides]ANZ64399.1 ethanolamine utilization protein EutP [Secundilactobacillus paracollinoides]KRL76128.1 ethanolamine utilization protein, EutP [Secundilactobacillus paracollinoides DSM 15502 = JCM 11969]